MDGQRVGIRKSKKKPRGKGDYEDCMTGVDAMVAAGIADPERLGAFGWSYGGYMTFWILTQTDRFKAGSPGPGLTNIYSIYSQTDIHPYPQSFFHGKAAWHQMDRVRRYVRFFAKYLNAPVVTEPAAE